MVLRKHFEQLKTPQSWQSPLAVIAHIDLDAFYAQCLQVRGGYDPTEPLGCRQWNALIAINYPARKYGLKRGVSCDEARALCPSIHLPHVATFKKGETTWAFHESPDANNYKVSLDFFRLESRKIFELFKKHFAQIEKAGIDEAFIDLGPEVYTQVCCSEKYKQTLLSDSDEIEITHDELIDIGAELVKVVRLHIHEELKYTCSAGISFNKQISKLASGYNKPFNQTTVTRDSMNEFLSNFEITDVWGWGGKIGKEVVQKLPADINKVEGEKYDQFAYIRTLTLDSLVSSLDDDFQLATSLYKTVRGNYTSEVKSRTIIKSMNAVKDFRKLTHLKNMGDVIDWLKVFSADLTLRIQNLRDDLQATIVPKTVVVKHSGSGVRSKQKPLNVNGFSVDEIGQQILLQSTEIAKELISFPCGYLAVEITGLYEQPKEQLNFKRADPKKRSYDELLDSKSPTTPTKVKFNNMKPSNDGTLKLFFDENKHAKETEESKDGQDTDNYFQCTECGKQIILSEMFDHEDWHFAKRIRNQELVEVADKSNKSPSKLNYSHNTSDSTKNPQNTTPNVEVKAEAPSKKGNQRSILEFYKK